MKSNKVLIGLFVGVLALIGGSATAQTKFYEVGPSNVGGHVSSLVIDQRDTNHTTVFAGAISGGLFMRSENTELLAQLYGENDAALAENHNTWHRVPCNDVLPITCMTQGADNTIYIGTGDNTYQVGSAFGRMSVLGKGIYKYNPETVTFTLLEGTNPNGQMTSDFAAVKHIAYVERDGDSYLYAVTGTGIFRWKNGANKTQVFAGEADEFLMVGARRVAYFTVGNQLYKIGDVTANNPTPVNISARNSAFNTPNIGIKLASAVSDPSYLYAMVIDKNGMMEALYLTTDEQNWTMLTTSTVTPLTKGAGENCGAMVVDPGNPKRIYIAGSTIWAGEGHVDGSYYQWTKSSYSEQELNYGDFMGGVASSIMYVHSGIHQIVPAWQNGAMVYYIATDGGVFTTNAFEYYENINLGLNNVQVNSLAVSPDGTVTSGAVSNAVVMINGRLQHNMSGTDEPIWFDPTVSGLNHAGNIIFSDNGGMVAASMFQQVKPASRRLVMVSNDMSNYGRAFDDYLDYSNTQTWTQGSDFITNSNYSGTSNTMGNIYLWETTNDTKFNSDSIHFIIDTLAYVLRKNSTTQEYDTVWLSLDGMTTGGVLVRDENGHIIDTVAVGTGHGSKFRILSGDKIMITSRANSEYPFEYTFTKTQLAGDKIVVKNPIQSRALIVARDSAANSTWKVAISFRATDFTKVWNYTTYSDQLLFDHSTLCLWYPIFECRTDSEIPRNGHYETGLRPRSLAMSADGTKVFIAVQDILTKESMIVRIKGFENINYYVDNSTAETRKAGYTRLVQDLSGPRGNSYSKLTVDTLKVNNSEWMPRLISSIMTDTNSDGAERLIVTFEDYNSTMPNVAIVNNCNSDNWSLTEQTITGHANIPAYCAMVEKTTGDLYVGTAEGVFFRHGSTWAPYNNLQGIPVTAMKQQQANLPILHTLNHNGVAPVKYAFAKTKWPNAMYFGTYGRGIFIDKQYVTDTTNEVVDSVDNLGIPTVNTTKGSVSVYPNPVYGEAHLNVNSDITANGIVRIYDLNGRCVAVRHLGTVAEGENNYTISTEGLTKGMYLVNVIIGGYTSATKMMVR